MNYEQLYEIIDQLSVINPWKAKKLEALVKKQVMSKDENEKKQLKRKINNFIYNLFGSCLTRESRNDFFNTSISISEDCYEVEQREKERWFIYNDGARRYILNGDKVEVANFIPREYKKGFYVREREANTEEEKKQLRREFSFLFRNESLLKNISSLMDHRQELVTYGYEVKNNNIPSFFVEMLINYLGLSRVPQEENKHSK